MNKSKSIAFLKLRKRNEAGYLDQLYALQAIASQGVATIPILTRRERLNYDKNCRYHKCFNVFRSTVDTNSCSNSCNPTPSGTTK